MPTLKNRPKYRLCWWCNLQLRANFHRAMISTAHSTNGCVIVHAACGDQMVAEGWQDATAQAA